MAVPSIKGTAFQSAHEDVSRLVEQGRLSRDALEARLEPEDLRILAEKVGPASWYPIASYERIVRLLSELEARGREEAYQIERGTRAAERLSASGIYQQLGASNQQLGPRVGHIVVSLSGAIYNFTRWSFEVRGRSGSFAIRVDDAADFPEVARFASQGFIGYVATRVAGLPVRIASERPAPDRILYHGRPQ